MKISWGVKITLAYSLFVAATLIMVFIFMNQDVNLVSDDYYAKELDYQQQIDKEQRTSKLPEQITVKQVNEDLLIDFPAEFKNYRIEGKINFYRPSDSKKDFDLDIACNEDGRQIVACRNFEKGLWKIKVDWSAKGSSFYNESAIILE